MSIPTQRQRSSAEAFAALHRLPRGFVLPNVWDAGSAIILAESFPAIATTSAGIAFSLGKPDYLVGASQLAVSRDEMFDRMRQIVAAVDVPVNGDLEAGWGAAPDDVAETVGMAIDIGLAGGNIEDIDPATGQLYDEALAVERIEAAVETIRGSDAKFVLNARTDALLSGSPEAIATSIDRANRFLAAGAQCVFVPGVPDLETIRILAAEIDGPLNVVLGLTGSANDATAILDAGVQRISLGGTIARAALAFVRRCARELSAQGSIGFAADQFSPAELNRLFERRPAPLPARGDA